MLEILSILHGTLTADMTSYKSLYWVGSWELMESATTLMVWRLQEVMLLNEVSIDNI